MGIDGHDGAIGGFQTFFQETGADVLGDFKLGNLVVQALADALKGLVDNQAELFGGALVAGQLFGRPALGGVLHQVSGGDHLRAEAAHQLDGAGVHAGDAG